MEPTVALEEGLEVPRNMLAQKGGRHPRVFRKVAIYQLGQNYFNILTSMTLPETTSVPGTGSPSQ